jgi:3-oxoadipate enol-lactonase
MRIAQFGPASINYELSGQGPLVVLLHEIGGTLETWSPVVKLLPGFRVLRYDQRGAGRSVRVADPFSLDTQVDDIGALLDVLGERGPCHIAGVAIGAAFAIRFAARHPQRVKSLVLACPAPSVDAARIDYLKARADAVEREGMAATVESSLANSYPPELRRDVKTFDAYCQRFLANDRTSYAAINRAFADFDVTPDLPGIKCPALVLAGKYDKLRPPAFVRGVADKIPGARYAELPGGHIMPVQAPRALAAAMMDFYAAIGR